MITGERELSTAHVSVSGRVHNRQMAAKDHHWLELATGPIGHRSHDLPHMLIHKDRLRGGRS